MSAAAARAPTLAGAGEPLSEQVRPRLERAFGTDLRQVRVHHGDAAARLARGAGARAFATGTHVFLGAGENPRDLAVLAHEIAHVLQQGTGRTMRRFTLAPGGDSHEREAQRASQVVLQGGTVAIAESPGAPAVQALGISDALDFFAERANAIPGFRMFTIVLGVNPINLSRVERSAANILRAVIEFIPGGALITQALDNHGIFERVGAWVEQQISALGVTGALIRQALDRFLDSLGWRDIFNLGGVWDRARRIFSEPIDRILSTVRSFVVGIVRFIKDAILLPLARLAEGTRGYDLLKAVLGQDPISGQPVPRNAETLIGGFMRFIGQEEVWNNLQRSRAVPRAWTWFQGALEGLLGFVRQVPTLVVRAFQALELADIVLVPRAFSKIVNVFGGFVGRFISWAGAQVMSLLEIMFDVLAPAVMPYIRRAASAFRTIINDPIRFIGNLVRAGIQGFRQFAANFLTHLRTSLISWLTGTLSGANIHIPQAFTLIEIIKFVLSVLGLTWQNIRQKLVRLIGETAVRLLETGFDIVLTLVRDGPAAAWEKIQESLTNLREMVMGEIMNFVLVRVVQAAVTRLVTSLNPAGAFIQAILAIYNTIMFFVERLRQIAQVVASFIDSISAIANGVIAAAADRVERTMGGLLTLVISFLARLVGLGRVSDAVTNIVNRIRAPIDRALDRVVEWIRNMARRFLSRLMGGDPNATPQQRLDRAVQEGTDAVNRLSGSALGRAAIRAVLGAIRLRHNLQSLEPVVEGGVWAIEGVINPRTRRRSSKRASTPGTSADNPFEIPWPKRPLARYAPVWLVPADEANGREYSQARLQAMTGAQLFRPGSPRALFGGPTIGVASSFRTAVGKVFSLAPHSRPSTPQLTAFKDLFKRHGYNRERGDSEGTTDADHVCELQMMGPPGDVYANLWPLNLSENRSSGSTLSNWAVVVDEGPPATTRKIRDLPRATFYFKIIRCL